jgi:hypothetical protein
LIYIQFWCIDGKYRIYVARLRNRFVPSHINSIFNVKTLILALSCNTICKKKCYWKPNTTPTLYQFKHANYYQVHCLWRSVFFTVFSNSYLGIGYIQFMLLTFEKDILNRPIDRRGDSNIIPNFIRGNMLNIYCKIG